MIALQIWMTKGEDIGWSSSTALTLLVIAVLSTTAFVYIETRPDNTHPFIDFQLFTNRTFTGCLISNMLLNGTAAGMVLVVSLVLQTAGTLTALQVGNLTIGYAIGLILFIRLGEKLLQRCGPRTAMIIGCVIAAVGVAMMLPTNTLQSTYIWLTIAGFSLYGIGVGIYATPSTDTALANLPDAMGAAGSGLYKMSSTIGGAFGLALTSAIYLNIRGRGEGADWITHLLDFAGRQDNLANREGAMLALLLNVVALLIAVISVAWAVPREQKTLT
ncbi:Quinolone resistance protein norB [Dermatophilus congolensis]|uniref:Quinolone resistance protein norB n=2 Tax=Dermatophilus congolensis TaxID=1863 RepID=A0AA46H1H0_9MICO|nr:Quinolone resistance protein norB [Dermatophilus congolensis]